MSDKKTKLLVEVWKQPGGALTVVTETPCGSGTRLCGIKLTGSGSTLVGRFFLDKNAVEAILEDFEIAEREGGAS